MSTSIFRVTEHKVPCQHIRDYAYATTTTQEDVLHLAVKQYTPLDNLNPQPGDITILGAHANGFPKELYEPLWDELHKISKSQGFRIRTIFIADVAHQNWSSVLNESKIGNDPSWLDHSRDMLTLINHFRADFQRPIIGIGHSMGGAQLTQLAIMHPRLLTTLILIDPVIMQFGSRKGAGIPAQASAIRRELWPSRQAAADSFGRSRFYKTWDPRVLQCWIQHGLRDLPTKLHPVEAPARPYDAPLQQTPVTLTTTKHQEVLTFLRQTMPAKTPGFSDDEWERLQRLLYPDVAGGQWEVMVGFYRPEPVVIFNGLPNLRPSVLYVFAEYSDLSNPALRKDKLDKTGIGWGGSGGVKAGRVKEVVIKGAGHLVPMEKVIETAENAGIWIGNEMKRWRSDEALLKKRWDSLPEKERYTMSDHVINKFKKGVMDSDKPKI